MEYLLFVSLPLFVALCTMHALRVAWPEPIPGEDVADKPARASRKKAHAVDAHAKAAVAANDSKPLQPTTLSRTDPFSPTYAHSVSADPKGMDAHLPQGQMPEQNPHAYDIPDNFNIHEFQAHREAA